LGHKARADPAPFGTEPGATLIVDAGARFAGDSVNIDHAHGGQQPDHSILLDAGTLPSNTSPGRPTYP
jgi:hypothetical protein